MKQINLLLVLLFCVSSLTYGSEFAERHFMLSLPYESSDAHDYFGIRISGSGPLQSAGENVYLHMGAELGSYDLPAIDIFTRLKADLDLSYYFNIPGDNMFSKISPFIKGGIEYDYLSNKEQYTTGYDFTPYLSGYDFYWREYVETGFSTSFFNYKIGVGLEYELIKDKLNAAYSFNRLMSSESDLTEKNSHKVELSHALEDNKFLYLSYQIDDLFFEDNNLWCLGYGWKR